MGIFKKTGKKIVSFFISACVLMISAGKLLGKLKKRRKENRKKTDKQINVVFNNSKLRKFVDEFCNVVNKDYEDSDFDIADRDIIRILYTDQMENIDLLNEVKITPSRSFLMMQGGSYSIFFLVAFLISILILLTVFLLKGQVNANIENCLKLACLVLNISGLLISFVSVLKSRKKNIPEIVMEVDISDDVLNRKFGTGYKYLLDRLHNDVGNLIARREANIRNIDEKFLKVTSRIYSDLFEAMTMKSQNNVENYVIPIFRQLLKTDLNLKIFDYYDAASEKYFDIQTGDMGISKVLKPAILSSDGELIVRGLYYRKV